MKAWSVLVLGLLAAGAAWAQDEVHCGSCEEWNKPVAPFKVYGNTWYVGTAGLSSLLVTGPQGHVLLDGALPQSAAQIRKNIESLGFRIEDVKLILNSHSHWDHSGGIAALQRASGAQVAASAWSAKELAAGDNVPGDPQYDPRETVRVPKIDHIKVVADGEKVTVGPLTLTAHLTPGHTPGSTAWTWQSCEDKVCRNMVYADSLTAVSTDGFHFTGDADHPDISASFRASIAKLGALPCDVVVSTHPGFTDTFEKLAARTLGHNTFVQAGGCKALAEASARAFDKRVAAERAQAEGR
ncbi:subclass B3 metallo-beta-lactamase [Massilia solisilvae]|uniref:Subclass B3 metallo-beta-lactamase n=1 Tax=Massilia solisilvae TaxID=1811225 RepID=A0ABT2BQA7_9BURK|nr:subclass B3 metallo-beta-lactamase [Massilia solisilvae]MCS0610684.1 subclass B3 metallo-beta-lactamase [Massilia solisilvae]